MPYLSVWLTAYLNPPGFARRLAGKPAPLWGLWASLQRALMDAVLLYLPLALLGRIPPTGSYLSFIPDEHYYAALVGITLVVLPAQWLLGGATIHLVLRLSRYESDFDTILNITGFVSLAIGSVLLLWDWIWIVLGGLDQYSLGISHLLIDIWGIAIGAVAFRHTLGVPVRLGALLQVVGIAVALPVAIMFMRSPL